MSGAAAAAGLLLIGGVAAGIAYLNGGSSPPPPSPIAAAPARPPAVATSPAAKAPTRAPLAAAGAPPAVATALPSIPRADDEPRKALAASARHVDTTDPTPAVLHAPAARRGTPVATLDPRASKSAPNAPALPPAALVDTTAILDRGQSAFDRGDYQAASRAFSASVRADPSFGAAQQGLQTSQTAPGLSGGTGSGISSGIDITLCLRLPSAVATPRSAP